MSKIIYFLIIFGALTPTLPIPPSITMRISIVIVILICGSMLQSHFEGDKRYLKFIFLFAASVCIVPMVAKGEYDSLFVVVICSGLLGVIAFRYLKNASAMLWFIGILCAYFAIFYFIHGSLEEVFYQFASDDQVGVSRNFVGILLLHYYLIYYAICVNNGIKAKHWPIWIIPIISVMSGGVSSVVTSVLLLIGWLFLLWKAKATQAIAISILLAIVFFGAVSLFKSTQLYERLETEKVGLDRLVLWSSFYERLTIKSILVGYDKDTEFTMNPLSSYYSETDNLHSSYLNIYKKVGAFSIFYLILMAYISCALYRIDKCLCLIYSITLLRASTDGYYFVSFLIDFIVFYLLLMTPFGSRFRETASSFIEPTLRQSARVNGKEKVLNLS